MDHGTRNTSGSAGGQPWRGMRTALTLLTVLPVPAAPAPPPAGTGYLSGAAVWFPVVGAGVGGLGALVLVASGEALGLGLPLAAIAAVGTTVAVTGALHEDGLADFADGAGGGWTRADRLRIMRDSRTGSFGVLALLFSVGVRVAALVALDDAVGAGLALVAAAAISRGMLPAVMRLTPPVRPDGAAAAAGRVSGAATVIAAAVATGIAGVCLAPGAAALAIAAGGFAAAAVAGLAVHAVGGHTGDVLGAAQQAAEAAVLVVLAGLR